MYWISYSTAAHIIAYQEIKDYPQIQSPFFQKFRLNILSVKTKTPEHTDPTNKICFYIRLYYLCKYKNRVRLGIKNELVRFILFLSLYF